jgi:hypothetical protein
MPQHERLLPLLLDLHDGKRGDADVEAVRGDLNRALTIMSQVPPPSAEGYRLFRLLGRDVSWLDVPRDPCNGYAVLGAHEHADLVLANDAGVCPRHLVAIVGPVEDAGPGLRLIDLRTNAPSPFEDDAPRRSYLARGMFATRVGRHIVCGLPVAPATVPGNALHIVAARARGEANDEPESETERRASRSASTSVRPADGAPLARASDASLPGAAGHVRLTLSRRFAGRWWTGRSTEVPLVELDGGMILGRAYALAAAFDLTCDTVSRTHLLLLRERGHLCALDLASSNGTRVNSERIRRYRIPESGARLELGKQLLVTIGRWSAEAPPQGAA